MIARLAPLSHASRDFLARWKIAERRSTIEGRRFEAMIALLVCAAILTTAVFGDEAITLAMRNVAPFVKTVFLQITKLGESGWIFALSAVVMIGALLARRRGLGARADAALGLLAGRAFFLIAANAVSGLLSLVVKMTFGRARPRLYDVVGPFHFDLFSVKSSVLSFPSGHAVTAFATATALAFMAPRAAKALIAIAILIGVSRVVTGAHYTSDVIAGMAVGVATVVFLRRAFAARGIVFRQRAAGIELRGAGLVWPALRRAATFWSPK
ncbi:MAG: phosphatase family protein [Hyphomicrobiales bacterium]|jgi:membrane-associated phospholipid phosphatase|nr:phosphatase family protein [Hyphomicrobiales bacterium]